MPGRGQGTGAQHWALQEFERIGGTRLGSERGAEATEAVSSVEWSRPAGYGLVSDRSAPRRTAALPPSIAASLWVVAVAVWRLARFPRLPPLGHQSVEPEEDTESEGVIVDHVDDDMYRLQLPRTTLRRANT